MKNLGKVLVVSAVLGALAWGAMSHGGGGPPPPPRPPPRPPGEPDTGGVPVYPPPRLFADGQQVRFAPNGPNGVVYVIDSASFDPKYVFNRSFGPGTWFYTVHDTRPSLSSQISQFAEGSLVAAGPARVAMAWL